MSSKRRAVRTGKSKRGESRDLPVIPIAEDFPSVFVPSFPQAYVASQSVPTRY